MKWSEEPLKWLRQSKGGDLSIMLHDSRTGDLGCWGRGCEEAGHRTGLAGSTGGVGSFWSRSVDGEEPVETALSPLERQYLGGVWALALCGGGLGFQGGRSGPLVWLAEVAGSVLVDVSVCFPE